jgi:hypothetical protein
MPVSGLTSRPSRKRASAARGCLLFDPVDLRIYHFGELDRGDLAVDKHLMKLVDGVGVQVHSWIALTLK